MKGHIHDGAALSGARVFYELLGFRPGEPAAPGPEGGSRRLYRLDVPGPGLPRPA
ncbi:hypothetical protein [Streptomyces cyaneofuscatus]|uniref:hypothetical protein n=1 Tax=Streptomyces cyaneofuscatus TaxID=66883 RepID=UPI0036683F4C